MGNSTQIWKFYLRKFDLPIFAVFFIINDIKWRSRSLVNLWYASELYYLDDIDEVILGSYLADDVKTYLMVAAWKATYDVSHIYEFNFLACCYEKNLIW